MGDHQPSSRGLRMMTYLSPGLPIELFEVLRDYLEEKTGRRVYLIYESRWSGPPKDQDDPLTSDDADIVFMSTSSFLGQKDKKNAFMELCEAAPLHDHPKAFNDGPVCFSEVVVPKSKRYRDFKALKGSRWAFTDDTSVSGKLVMLAELRSAGYNANFFGSITPSGSHLNSIKMLLHGQADVASVNSCVLNAFRLEHREEAETLHVIKSLGPLPIYPIVFNSRLPTDLKKTITEALVGISKEDKKWAAQLNRLGVKDFMRSSEDNYQEALDIIESVKNMTITPAYY